MTFAIQSIKRISKPFLMIELIVRGTTYYFSDQPLNTLNSGLSTHLFLRIVSTSTIEYSMSQGIDDLVIPSFDFTVQNIEYAASEFVQDNYPLSKSIITVNIGYEEESYASNKKTIFTGILDGDPVIGNDTVVFKCISDYKDIFGYLNNYIDPNTVVLPKTIASVTDSNVTITFFPDFIKSAMIPIIYGDFRRTTYDIEKKSSKMWTHGKRYPILLDQAGYDDSGARIFLLSSYKSTEVLGSTTVAVDEVGYWWPDGGGQGIWDLTKCTVHAFTTGNIHVSYLKVTTEDLVTFDGTAFYERTHPFDTLKIGVLGRFGINIKSADTSGQPLGNPVDVIKHLLTYHNDTLSAQYDTTSFNLVDDSFDNYSGSFAFTERGESIKNIVQKICEDFDIDCYISMTGKLALAYYKPTIANQMSGGYDNVNNYSDICDMLQNSHTITPQFNNTGIETLCNRIIIPEHIGYSKNIISSTGIGVSYGKDGTIFNTHKSISGVGTIAVSASDGRVTGTSTDFKGTITPSRKLKYGYYLHIHNPTVSANKRIVKISSVVSDTEITTVDFNGNEVLDYQAESGITTSKYSVLTDYSQAVYGIHPIEWYPRFILLGDSNKMSHAVNRKMMRRRWPIYNVAFKSSLQLLRNDIGDIVSITSKKYPNTTRGGGETARLYMIRGFVIDCSTLLVSISLRDMKNIIGDTAVTLKKKFFLEHRPDTNRKVSASTLSVTNGSGVVTAATTGSLATTEIGDILMIRMANNRKCARVTVITNRSAIPPSVTVNNTVWTTDASIADGSWFLNKGFINTSATERKNGYLCDIFDGKLSDGTLGYLL